MEVHRVVLVKRSGSCLGSLPRLLKIADVEGRTGKLAGKVGLRRSCVVLLLGVDEEVDGRVWQVRPGPM